MNCGRAGKLGEVDLAELDDIGNQIKMTKSE